MMTVRNWSLSRRSISLAAALSLGALSIGCSADDETPASGSGAPDAPLTEAEPEAQTESGEAQTSPESSNETADVASNAEESTEESASGALPLEGSDGAETAPVDEEIGVETGSEEAAPEIEEMTPEEMTPEEMTPEEMTPEEMTPEEMTPEEMIPEEMTPEEMTPEEMTPEEMTPEEPEQPVNSLPEGTHPDIVDIIDVAGRNPGGDSWKDSYSVGDQCYCESTFDHAIGGIEVDTPDGTKTVREVCDAIGDGPGSDGHPIYNDIQCGNGPANDAGDEDDCPGRVDIGRDGCGHIGPKWDLSVFE